MKQRSLYLVRELTTNKNKGHFNVVGELGNSKGKRPKPTSHQDSCLSCPIQAATAAFPEMKWMAIGIPYSNIGTLDAIAGAGANTEWVDHFGDWCHLEAKVEEWARSCCGTYRHWVKVSSSNSSRPICGIT